MVRAAFLVPIAGILIAAAVPLTRYVEKQRHEQAVIDVLQQVRHAQRAFQQSAGGYATAIETLTTGCGSERAVLGLDVLSRLRDAGYRLTVRGAIDAPSRDRPDCHGRPLARDYYAAVEPLDAFEAGQQAFSARAEGDIYVFFDGVAPTEGSIARGLATPLAQRSRFRIP